MFACLQVDAVGERVPVQQALPVFPPCNGDKHRWMTLCVCSCTTFGDLASVAIGSESPSRVERCDYGRKPLCPDIDQSIFLTPSCIQSARGLQPDTVRLNVVRRA